MAQRAHVEVISIDAGMVGQECDVWNMFLKCGVSKGEFNCMLRLNEFLIYKAIFPFAFFQFLPPKAESTISKPRSHLQRK
jgi:hypothetical protein